MQGIISHKMPWEHHVQHKTWYACLETREHTGSYKHYDLPHHCKKMCVQTNMQWVWFVAWGPEIKLVYVGMYIAL